MSGAVARPPSSERVTKWLTDWQQGSQPARDHLFAVVYPQLQNIALKLLRRERRDHTLEPRALVHELYARVLGGQTVAYRDRIHFFAIAAQTMRRILIDYARARAADKRGGEPRRVTLSGIDGWHVASTPQSVVELDDLLSKLEAADPRAARVVELRFFGGLTEEETADVLGISARTVKRDWKVARAWLIAHLHASR
jgi:RNA polymerase sigma factor (TIGR02999 family)